MLLAVATVLFATQVYTVCPAFVVSWLHNSTELLLVCTSLKFSNNWYVCTKGFPTAEQVMLIVSPLQMVRSLLSTVNRNFSGLTRGYKVEQVYESNTNCSCSKTYRRNVSLREERRFRVGLVR